MAYRFTSVYLYAMLGAVTSCTVTVASALALLRLPSVAVSLTVFGPRLAQVKALLSMLRLIGPQASVVPPSTSAATMVAWPVASRFTSMCLVTTFGGVVSFTVSFAVQVLLLLAASLTVTVIVCGPRPTSVPTAGVWVFVREPEAVQLSVAVTPEVKSGTGAWQLPLALTV